MEPFWGSLIDCLIFYPCFWVSQPILRYLFTTASKTYAAAPLPLRAAITYYTFGIIWRSLNRVRRSADPFQIGVKFMLGTMSPRESLERACACCVTGLLMCLPVAAMGDVGLPLVASFNTSLGYTLAARICVEALLAFHKAVTVLQAETRTEKLAALHDYWFISTCCCALGFLCFPTGLPAHPLTGLMSSIIYAAGHDASAGPGWVVALSLMTTDILVILVTPMVMHPNRKLLGNKVKSA